MLAGWHGRVMAAAPEAMRAGLWVHGALRRLPEACALEAELEALLRAEGVPFWGWSAVDAFAAGAGFPGQEPHLDHADLTQVDNPDAGKFTVSIALDDCAAEDGGLGYWREGTYARLSVRAGDVYLVRPWTLHCGSRPGGLRSRTNKSNPAVSSTETERSAQRVGRPTFWRRVLQWNFWGQAPSAEDRALFAAARARNATDGRTLRDVA